MKRYRPAEIHKFFDIAKSVQSQFYKLDAAEKDDYTHCYNYIKEILTNFGYPAELAIEMINYEIQQKDVNK